MLKDKRPDRIIQQSPQTETISGIQQQKNGVNCTINQLIVE